jgi:antitoxin component YwqK of YwqJK toxin-antitoxin module
MNLYFENYFFINFKKKSTLYLPKLHSMKTVLLFFFLCFATHALKAQDYKYIYYLDEHMVTVPKKDATIIGKGYKENGSLHVDCYLASNSFLFLKINYSDSTLKTYNGPYTSYNKDGGLLESGTYKNGLLEGAKEKWNEKGNLTDSLIYHNDKLFAEYNFGYDDKNRRNYFTIKDSLADTLYSRAVDENNSVTYEVKFKGQKGVMIKYKDGVATRDSLFTREEREASFPGGQQAWAKFLQENLDANVPVRKKAKAGKYQVVVRFIVNKDGEISDISAETNLGHGMEQEVIRLIKTSPKWIPASQYGRKVNAYRRQPVTFQIDEK